MDRYSRQRRLAEIGDAGQARLLAASHRVAGTDGALTELAYLHRAGFRAVTLDAIAEPRPFAHAELFRHDVTRRQAAGTWRALRAITELLARPHA
jgi:molybdopterin/thiamine biosynthesis adenylyltransferase